MRVELADAEAVHDRRWLTLVVICISLLVISLDNTILNVALPTLGRASHLGGLGASESQLQWIVDGYTIVFAGLLLSAGSLGDRFGRYGALAFGLAVFGVGSAAASQASSASMLIAFRCVMGLGGAFIMPSTLSILTNVFTDRVERGRAIGIWAGVAAIGIGVGPVTGGFLLGHFWWGSVLMVNIPIVVVALVAGYFFVPSSKDPAAPKLDPLGAVLSIGALAALLWAVIEAPSIGWGSSSVLIAFVVGTGALGAFLAWEFSCPSPMLNVRYFANPRFSAASGAIALVFLALFGTVFLLTQYLQAVQGFSPLKAGALLVPMGVVLLVVSPLSARMAEWAGTKLVVGGGLTILALSFVLMRMLGETSSPWAIVGVTVVLALGMGNVMAPATESIMGSLPREKAGVGSAINDTTRQVGGAVGVAGLGSLLSTRFRTDFDARATSAHVPHALAAAAHDNIQHALGVARSAPGSIGEHVVSVAKSSFVDGFHLASIAAAVIVAAAAVGVFVWLPARAADVPDGQAGKPEGTANTLGAAETVDQDATPEEVETVLAETAVDGSDRHDVAVAVSR